MPDSYLHMFQTGFNWVMAISFAWIAITILYENFTTDKDTQALKAEKDDYYQR